MSITKEVKQKLIKSNAVSAKDTGSPEVQIAVFSERIKNLTGHLKIHPQDNSSEYGLIKLVGQRRRLLDYLKEIDMKRYDNIIKKLGLRK